MKNSLPIPVVIAVIVVAVLVIGGVIYAMLSSSAPIVLPSKPAKGKMSGLKPPDQSQSPTGGPATKPTGQ